jgi:hypothetical protein
VTDNSVAPAAGGGVTISLSHRERELLRSLPDQLRPLVSGDEPAPSVAGVLYSRGYDDDELEVEYRSLIGDDIVTQRVSALDAFAATLEAGAEHRGIWTVELDADEAGAWLSAVNDGRLVLAALLGITDESQWETGPADENPASIVLNYLGWLQTELVDAMMTTLPDQ